MDGFVIIVMNLIYLKLKIIVVAIVEKKMKI
jgi:hypothetical protein